MHPAIEPMTPNDLISLESGRFHFGLHWVETQMSYVGTQSPCAKACHDEPFVSTVFLFCAHSLKQSQKTLAPSPRGSSIGKILQGDKAKTLVLEACGGPGLAYQKADPA